MFNSCRKTPFIFFLAVIVCFGFISCQKDVDPTDPDPTPQPSIDSTLLIEQLTYITGMGGPDEDSVIETYSYDTVNRKIVVSWTGSSDSYIEPGTMGEFRYNQEGLLSKVVFNYPSGYLPQNADYSEINIAYDAARVLQSINVKYGDGSTGSQQFVKTVLPSGHYQLSWAEDKSPDGDSTYRRCEFDKDGKPLSNYVEEFFSAGTVDEETFSVLETFEYVGDNVMKVQQKRIDTDGAVQDLPLYEYTRHTKGDQLFNQRQILMNGIANIPFGDFDDIVADAFGVLSISLSYEALQFSKFPIQTAKALIWDGSFQDFVASSTFDSKNRLTNFTGFAHDYSLDPVGYRVYYFK